MALGGPAIGRLAILSLFCRPVVVVPVHIQHFMMLQRNLFYTAVTRGKRLVVLVGTTKAIAIAVKRTEASRRITTLKQRLVEQAGSGRS